MVISKPIGVIGFCKVDVGKVGRVVGQMNFGVVDVFTVGLVVVLQMVVGRVEVDQMGFGQALVGLVGVVDLRVVIVIGLVVVVVVGL